MTTQLRLVEAPARQLGQKQACRHARSRARTAAGRPARGRRAASWGEWQLDARTRRVGRAGVAAARRALEAATSRPKDGLSKAS